MKQILICLAILTSFISAQQKYYSFSELKGMEDNQGNTQLFYRLYDYEKRNAPLDDYEENSIYHMDVNSNSDSLLLFDGGTLFNNFKAITDYEFWNKNPAKYIYNATFVTVDPSGYIFRYDSSQYLLYVFGGHDGNLKISNQNDSLIYSSINGILFQSVDGGWTWDTVSTIPINLLAISPKNDQTIFGSTFSGELSKSVDGGKTFSVVDTSKSNFVSDNKILFDKDTNYVYRVSNDKNSYILTVSNNRGNAFSWTRRFSSTSKLFISVDYSQPGAIYLAGGKYIYVSNNFGESFSLYKTLNRNIIGIYKKPNSNLLYAATKYDLYEVTPDTIKTLKHLPINPGLFEWYPLSIGNKWIYDRTVCYLDNPPVPCNYYNDVVEVTKDTILLNGFKYFKVHSSSGDTFERYDYEDGTVRRFIEDSSFNNNEFIIEDLTAEPGDTSFTNRFNNYNSMIPKIFIEEDSEYLFNNIYPGKKYLVQDLGWERYSLVKGFGIDSISSSFDFGSSVSHLKGCIINGIVYGDTTVVGVEDKGNTLPAEFSLSQNYPNPFNPTTNFEFQIANHGFVSLKIFDLLGREIITLVNEEKPTGVYKIRWNAGNLSSGVYIYQLKTGSFNEVKKLLLLK